MELQDFVSLCQDFSNLGWAVQEQLTDVLDGEELEEQNPNALGMIRDFLKDAVSYAGEGALFGAEELADEIDQYLSL